MIEKLKNTTDFGVQTLLHPIESFIDKDYQWNEWKLRHNALKLVS